MKRLQDLEGRETWVEVVAMCDSGRRLHRRDQSAAWPDMPDEVLKEFLDHQYIADSAYGCLVGGVSCLIYCEDADALPNGQPRQ